MRIIVTGGNGQLGSDIVRVLNSQGMEAVSMIHENFDITSSESYISVLENKKPDWIVNTAAFHQVDKCEEFPEQAYLVNAVAPAQLARICKERNIGFIHISTDYVFDGIKKAPYIETDAVNPLNQYGRSKALGEELILNANSDAIIVRVSGLYGLNPCRAKGGNNFVQLMLKLGREKGEVKVVNDEYISPTYTEDAAHQIMEIIKQGGIKGIVHCTGEGQCTWFEFASKIFELSGTTVNTYPATSLDFPAKVPRPSYSVLENSVLKKAGIHVMRPWHEALHDYIKLIM